MILFPRAAAKDPATKPRALDRLSHSHDPRIIRLVAANPSTPEPALQRLARRSDERVRALVAGNPSTPADVLTSLASDRDEDVRLAVASNTAAPSAALDTLLSQRFGVLRPSEEMRAAVARNENATSSLLSTLAKDPSGAVQVAVATNRATPLSARAELFREAHLRPLLIATGYLESPSARIKVAQTHQYSRPYGVLEILAHDSNAAVRRAVAAAPDAGPELLKTLTGDTELNVAAVAKAASEKNPTELSRMASSDDELVLSVLHRNPSTRAEVKGALAIRLLPKSDVATLSRIAREEATPSEVVDALASHADQTVRLGVAQRVGLSTQTQVRLAGDASEHVRKAVATNATTQPLLLARLAADSASSVRQEVARNVRTPPDALITLGTDADVDVQVAVAANRNAPSAAISVLMTNGSQPRHRGFDPVRQVSPRLGLPETRSVWADPRGTIALNPNAPADVLRELMGSRKDLHWLLLCNPATPGDVIDQIAHGLLVERAERWSSRTRWVPTLDEDVAEGMLQAAQGNPSTPDETLRFLRDAALVRDRTTRVYYTEDGHTLWDDEVDEKATEAAPELVKAVEASGS